MRTEKAPNPARRSERSRQAILTAALDLVIEVGYRKLTMEAIAGKAGVGKQTIYRWWPSKGAVVLDAILALSQGDTGDSTLPDTGDVEADLKLVLRASLEEMGDRRFDVLYRAVITEIQYDPALTEEMGRRLLGPMLELSKDRLRAAQRAGQIAENADLDVAVELIYGSVYYRWLLGTGPLTAEYADRVVDWALNGLRPRPAG
ncbi:TetR/AcrR family transcriptional regulator [Streptoalloteichus hindustanus]|uniref:Transcriptional regulator, TetR family n=1 Tax=Streptoalloteichus hindustanus TaxID=2017 RepID=A0A1M4Z507_STRHI|nr:TetR/AcrR family transcriptional regulator [Streptoalloteichus hindustanus]SHF12877.1 transcriptional regulator, TetR family [Streptoalloteichus hindustanus]